MEDEIKKEAQYNQASYQQQRINELLSIIDRCSMNPLLFIPEINSYNYQIVIQNLGSIFSTTQSKFQKGGKKDVIKIQKEITDLESSNPIWKTIFIDSRSGRRIGTFLQPESWKNYWKKICDYRILLETLMDTHGFGNPTKDDAGMSVIKGGGN